MPHDKLINEAANNLINEAAGEMFGGHTIDKVLDATPPRPRPTDPMLQFFVTAHLRADLAEVAEPFADQAQRIVDTLPRNPERTVALRKLLESKDCAVRALLWKDA